MTTGPIGIAANPASGKDVRRLVARASVFDNQEKCAIIRRAVVGALAAGAREFRYLPDTHGITEAALSEFGDALEATAVDSPETGSALAAGLVMGLMLIPFVSSLSDDVINAVPQSLRDGAYALGATRAETARNVILPAALPGIVGGLLLGPIVQSYAFGAFWTGWPVGSDLTDNKTAIAVLAWLPATLLALLGRHARVAVVVGWLVMMAVFLIPHSLRGSQLDWSAVENGSPPAVSD